MKKLLVFAAFFVAASSAVKAQEIAKPVAAEQPVLPGAIITFEETKHDFGQIRQGDIVNHTFTFKNTGTKPLIVSNDFTTCGCTVSEWTKTPVLPGKTGILKASFDSTNKSGKQHKVLTIESNSDNGNTTVSILTDIQPKDAVLEIKEVPALQPATVESLPEIEKKSEVSTAPKKIKYKSKKKSRR